MLCPKCGGQIPDGSKFCNHCSAELTPSTKSAPAQQSSSDDAPKKTSNLAVILIVALCAFLVGKYIIAPSFTSDINTDTTVTTSSRFSTDTEDTEPSRRVEPSTVGGSSAAYELVFSDTQIVHLPPFYAMDTVSYAKKADDGIILCLDYGYEDDIVKHFSITEYVPIVGYSDAEKAELQRLYREKYASRETLSCCTVTYNMSANYLTVTCTFKDVDTTANYSAMYYAGLTTSNNPLGMYVEEQELLAEGYAKK